MGNRFPIYIPTKGRSEYMLTSKALSRLGLDHYLIVEPAEVKSYEKAIDSLRASILPLDLSFKEKYELCDSLGLSKSTGPGPARNFAWEHSIGLGAEWHWVMDDNIKSFRRLHRGAKVRVESAGIFRAMEDFVLRYSNVAMAGPNYAMFAYSADPSKVPPFYLNTRIYSCNLIRNDVPFRWRGRYNEDTILSLDMLKAGWCTIQFNAFLQEKLRTQTIGGGNTAEFYASEGTLEKSRMQARIHPDVSKLVHEFQRYHHFVDYSEFRTRPLIRRPGLKIERAPDEYGMRLKTISG